MRVIVFQTGEGMVTVISDIDGEATEAMLDDVGDFLDGLDGEEILNVESNDVTLTVDGNKVN